MGIQLLREVIQEMNTLESARSIAKHRKVASSFRDEMLFPIFSLSCTLLRQMNIQDEQQVGVSTCIHVYNSHVHVYD